jgi:hypothetical protein
MRKKCFMTPRLTTMEEESTNDVYPCYIFISQVARCKQLIERKETSLQALDGISRRLRVTLCLQHQSQNVLFFRVGSVELGSAISMTHKLLNPACLRGKQVPLTLVATISPILFQQRLAYISTTRPYQLHNLHKMRSTCLGTKSRKIQHLKYEMIVT